MKGFYQLPEGINKDIEIYQSEIESFMKGEMHPAQFRGKRVPRGIYEQRANGTFMMRIRIPAGGMTPVQMEKVAELSKKFGNGILHITTRQDVQLHWIKLVDTPKVMSELSEVGLTTKGGGGNTVRNITACYEAGICKKELFDVSPYAIALTEQLIKDKKSYTLPRKFKIAFSGCGEDCSFATVNDVGFIATERSLNGKTEFGFQVFVAGGMGAYSRVGDRLESFVPLNEAGNVAEAIKRLFDKNGNRKNKHKARLRFLFEKLGTEAFVKLYRDELRNLKKEGGIKLDIRKINSSLEHSKSPTGNTENSQKSDAFKRWLSENTFSQKQEGYNFVKIFLELGDITAEQMTILAGIVKKFREGSLRSAHDQNLVLRWAHNSELKLLYDELKKAGLERAGANTVQDIMCCAGASTCRLGICLSRGLSTAISEDLENNGGKLNSLDIKLKISGCPNACGQNPIGQIGFFGASRRVGTRIAPFYTISVGGRVGQNETTLGENIGMCASKDIPTLLRKFLMDFDLNSQNKDFYEYLKSRGTKVLKEMIGKLQNVPIYDDNKDYYCDWGADEEFSLAGRGEGECGAGVFDMVEIDIAEAKKYLNIAGNPAPELYQAVNRSSRALLVIKGAEPKSDSEVFEFFEELFITPGLVDKKFRRLVYMAIEYKNGNLKDEALKNNVDLIKEFVKTIDGLYNSLDNSLQFKTENEKKEPKTEEANKMESPARENYKSLDLKGVQCPFNYVKAKLQLETMELGETLELFLDEGEPIKNVPNSLKNDGQEILEMEKADEKHYRLLIKKKV